MWIYLVIIASHSQFTRELAANRPTLLLHSASPQNHPPSPSLERLQIPFLNLLAAVLEALRQLLEALLHRLGHPQRHLVLEHVEDGEDEKGNARQAAVAEYRVLDPLQEAL
ncbi:hypothetical protein MKX07_005787 [Trichoderma sp. CBMAI-0711]|nr:hypothetical protein MKX07_005787 [Trichoderma sp. CBMAI-0711]